MTSFPTRARRTREIREKERERQPNYRKEEMIEEKDAEEAWKSRNDIIRRRERDRGNRALESDAYNFKRGSLSARKLTGLVFAWIIVDLQHGLTRRSPLGYRVSPGAPILPGTSLRHRDEDPARVPTMLHRINWYPRSRGSCVAVEHRHGPVHRRDARNRGANTHRTLRLSLSFHCDKPSNSKIAR